MHKTAQPKLLLCLLVIISLLVPSCQKGVEYTTVDSSDIEGLVQHPMGRWEAVGVSISGKRITFKDATTGERVTLNGGWTYHDFSNGSMTDVIRP